MRKFITKAIMAAALITTAGGTAYAVLGQSHFAAVLRSDHNLSVHVSHDGRALRHGSATLFTL
jgi:hypothetical protein